LTLPHPAALEPQDLLVDCDVRFLRRSGPGGQNRNKVETAVILRHRPTGLSAEASERRSQAENRRVALFRLRVLLALERRTRPEGVPTTLWHTRFAGRRLSINPDHDDFPAVLAEALDVIAAHADDVRPAAAALGCTPSQLVKLLKQEPRALARVNASRLDRGLHALR
jgi:hypothetical protein